MMLHLSGAGGNPMACVMPFVPHKRPWQPLKPLLQPQRKLLRHQRQRKHMAGNDVATPAAPIGQIAPPA
jgi:hypothetical protein